MNAQRAAWTRTVLLSGLLVLSGCGPSKEQQAIDAYNRGVDHLDKGEFDKAIADCNEAIRLDSRLRQAYSGRAVAYRALGDEAKADDSEYEDLLGLEDSDEENKEEDLESLIK